MSLFTVYGYFKMKHSSTFSFQPTLTGATFNIRALQKSDYAAISECAADKEIWAGHPATDRYKPEIFKVLFDDSISSKACVVFIEKETNKVAGWSRYYVADDGPDDISIGYTFLSREYWGGASNREIKSLLLNYAFNYFDRVWLHIAPTNVRSQKATLKLGASFVNEHLISLGGKPASVNRSYKIEKTQWQALHTD